MSRPQNSGGGDKPNEMTRIHRVVNDEGGAMEINAAEKEQRSQADARIQAVINELLELDRRLTHVATGPNERRIVTGQIEALWSAWGHPEQARVRTKARLNAAQRDRDEAKQAEQRAVN